MTAGIAITQTTVTSTQVMMQALVAVGLGLISSTVALVVRFEGSGKVFKRTTTGGIALLIIVLSTVGTAVAATALPLLGKVAPAAFLPLALVVPSGLAVNSKGRRRDTTEGSSALTNISRVLTLGISYLLRVLEDQMAEDAYAWASEQIRNWHEDGILGAADHFHEQLCSRFSSNVARCKEIEAIRDRIEEEIRVAGLTDDDRKKARSLEKARIDLRLLLQRAYAWGALSLTPYHGTQRSIITDGDVAYEVSVSYDSQSDDAGAVRPESVTAKELLELAVDLSRVGHEGDEAAIGSRLALLNENISQILKEMDERRSSTVDDPRDDGRREPGL